MDATLRVERGIEILTAALLSLATATSAWCVYQSVRWSGVQTFELATSNAAARQSASSLLMAQQEMTIDVAVFLEYSRARFARDAELADYLRRRFSPTLARATDAWIALEPLENREAPLTPFDMAEYELPQQKEARRLRDEAASARTQALQANQRSDDYVLLTVLFASVLFFGGIASKFESRGVHRFLIGLGAALYLTAGAFLLGLPIH